ncbi:MAG: hypothetical protein NTZ83_03230 [Candidatus Pacearchaeota archaeon]|nr:hypothetical protein [Candidatus Pacearchaeota archaeon]
MILSEKIKILEKIVKVGSKENKVIAKYTLNILRTSDEQLTEKELEYKRSFGGNLN